MNRQIKFCLVREKTHVWIDLESPTLPSRLYRVAELP
jgi:hypothetical protein